MVKRKKCWRCGRFTHLLKVRGALICTVCRDILLHELEMRREKETFGALKYLRDGFNALIGRDDSSHRGRFYFPWAKKPAGIEAEDIGKRGPLR